MSMQYDVKEALLNLQNSTKTPLYLIEASNIEFRRHPCFWQNVAIVSVLPVVTKHFQLTLRNAAFGTTQVKDLSSVERDSLRTVLDAYLEASALLENGDLNVLLQRAESVELTWQHLCVMDRLFSPEDQRAFNDWVTSGKSLERLSEALVRYFQETETI